MQRKIFTITFLLLSCYLIAQEKCGTTAITKYMMDTCPNYRIEKEKVNAETEKWIEEKQTATDHDIEKDFQIPKNTLKKWRLANQGPIFFRLGDKILYCSR